MQKRLPASMRTRQSLSELIEGRLGSPDGRAELVKLATRLIVEEALEAECRDALGRDYYERGGEAGRGCRNGVREGRLRTAEGMIDFAAPQVAGREEPFRSEIRGHLKGRTEALEGLAVELLARGLSVRDIEDAFRDESGRLLLSRTAVSELGEQLWADCQDFASRDLGEHEVVYLFVDGIAERVRPGQRREPVMAAWGFTATGAKVLLALMAGSKEDAETVTAFFQDMRARGLGDPLLVVSDGAPGVIKAIETPDRGPGQALLSPLGPPALPRAPHAQPRRQGARGPVARDQGAHPGLLPGPEPGDRPRSCRRRRRGPWPRPALGRRLLPGRLRGLHRSPHNARHPPPGDQDDEPARAPLRREAPPAEDHPQRLRPSAPS